MAAFAAVMMLTGCSGQTSSGASVSASDSAVATPSASVSAAGRISVAPPERPSVMDNNTEEGAAAAVAYYIRQSLYAEVTGDDSELQAMSGPGCEMCQYFIDRAQRDASGQWLEVPTVEVTSTDVSGSDAHSGAFHVELGINRGSGLVRNGSGKEIKVPAQKALIGFEVEKKNSGWNFIEGGMKSEVATPSDMVKGE